MQGKSVLLGLGLWAALAAPVLAAEDSAINLASSFREASSEMRQARRNIHPPRAVLAGYFSYDDNREPIEDSSESPYSLVGRLSGSEGTCTAFIVSRRAALTAAHCVDKKGGYTFRYESRGRKKKVRVFRIVFLPGYQKPVGNGAIDSRTDMAVLLFKEPLFLSGEGLTIADKFSVGQAAVALGFPGGDEEISPHCSIRNIKNGAILSDCVTSPGESGGPLLIRNNNQWEVAGIISSQLNPNDTRSGMGYSDETANRFCDLTARKSWVLEIIRDWESRLN